MSGAATPTPTYRPEGYLGDSPGINRLLDNVQIGVSGAPLPLVQMMAWNTIEEFYIRSTVRREVVRWQMAPGIQTVDFNPFDENWLVAWILGMADVFGLYRWSVVPPGAIKDLDYPRTPRHGRVLLALKPVSFNAGFGDELFQQWFETILSGTLSKLYLLPAKPYSSPQLADFHGKRYRGGISQARAIAQHQFTDGGGRWSFPRGQGFAMGVRKA